jgi:hypothetical protein
MFLDVFEVQNVFVRTQIVAGMRSAEGKKQVSSFSQKQMSKTKHHLCSLLQMMW